MSEFVPTCCLYFSVFYFSLLFWGEWGGGGVGGGGGGHSDSMHFCTSSSCVCSCVP